jgi:hypothetical protein
VRSPYACQGVTNEDVRGPGNNGDSASPKLVWRILAGIGWSVLFCFLFLGVGFASFYIGHFVGKRTVSWVSPVLRGTVAISLILLLTWLIRVKVNGNSWVGIRLPRLQATRLLSGAACGAFSCQRLKSSSLAISGSLRIRSRISSTSSPMWRPSYAAVTVTLWSGEQSSGSRCKMRLESKEHQRRL